MKIWLMNCPVCGQGRVIVHRRSDNGKLIAQCEECSVTWNSAQELMSKKGGYAGIDIAAEYATFDDLKNTDWAQQKLQTSND